MMSLLCMGMGTFDTFTTNQLYLFRLYVQYYDPRNKSFGHKFSQMIVLLLKKIRVHFVLSEGIVKYAHIS